MLAMFAAALAVGQPVFRTSQADVTPDELLPLGGYTERGEKTMELGGERLYARTLVFEDGATTLAIVSFEALTVPESLVAAVRRQIPEHVRLMLVATHTHCAPDSQMLNERMTFKVPGIASFSRRWLDWYAARIAEGVNSALKAEARDATALRLSFAEVDANRGRREGAQPIKTAAFVSLDGRALLTGYSAHATLYDADRLLTSGDWPGAVASGLGGLVLPGAIGDVSPSVENPADMVEKLRSGLASGQVKALFDENLRIAFLEEPVALSKPVPHPDFSKAYSAPAPLDQVLIDRFAPKEAAVSLALIGRLLLIGVPGEPTSELGRKLQSLAAKRGFPHTFVVSHTNGWIGYILAPEDYDRGGYEATLAFHGRGAADRMVEAVEKGLARLTQATPRVAHTR